MFYIITTITARVNQYCFKGFKCVYATTISRRKSIITKHIPTILIKEIHLVGKKNKKIDKHNNSNNKSMVKGILDNNSKVKYNTVFDTDINASIINHNKPSILNQIATRRSSLDKITIKSTEFPLWIIT